jgi:hypothetical protein
MYLCIQSPYLRETYIAAGWSSGQENCSPQGTQVGTGTV